MDNRTIVLVDDHATTRKLVGKALTRAGFVVHEARDGASALALMRQHRPAIVLQDLVLPDVDGFALAARLRALAGGLPVRLIAFSGLVSTIDAKRISSVGFDDVIAKPIAPSRLVALIEAHWAGAHPEVEAFGGGVVSVRGRGDEAAAAAAPLGALEHEHARSTERQLERQLLHNSELMRRNAQLSAELTILSSLSEAMLQQREVEGALVGALSSCLDASNSSFGALYLLDRHQHLRVHALGVSSQARGRTARLDGAQVEASELASFFGCEPWLREVIRVGGSVLLPSAPGREPRADEPLTRALDSALTRAGVARAIVAPLVHLGSPLGALFMAAHDGDQIVELEQWRTFAQGIANQITQALALSAAFRQREVAEREAEQQKRLVREQAGIWRALVDHAPDVVLQLDRQGRLRFINRLPPGLPEGARSSWFELVDADCHAELRGALAAVLSSGAARTIETSHHDSEGRQLFSESHVGPVRAGNEVVGVLVIQRDVTQKRLTDARLITADRMASVGTLAAGVAHELNDPLGSLTTNLELALRQARAVAPALPRELLAELGDARDAAERVRSIVRDLRNFARADEDARGPVEIERVLDSALRMAWNEVRHRARLIKEYQAVPPVEANEGRLAQVFLSLIINAAQAIDEGDSERNHIQLRLGSDAHGNVVVTVGDSGGGISPTLKSRLFTPFFTTKPPGVGIGLGLSTSRRIVTALGGSISVASELGKGTEFRVTLPTSGSVPPRALIHRLVR